MIQIKYIRFVPEADLNLAEKIALDGTHPILKVRYYKDVDHIDTVEEVNYDSLHKWLEDHYGEIEILKQLSKNAHEIQKLSSLDKFFSDFLNSNDHILLVPGDAV